MVPKVSGCTTNRCLICVHNDTCLSVPTFMIYLGYTFAEGVNFIKKSAKINRFQANFVSFLQFFDAITIKAAFIDFPRSSNKLNEHKINNLCTNQLSSTWKYVKFTDISYGVIVSNRTLQCTMETISCKNRQVFSQRKNNRNKTQEKNANRING